MLHHDSDKSDELLYLVERYEAMSQNGAVGFLEATVFQDLAYFYAGQQDLDSAEAVIQEGLGQHPFSASLYVTKAFLLKEREQYTEALEMLDKASAFDASDMENTLLRAEILTQAGAYSEAMSVLDDIAGQVTSAERVDVHLTRALIYEAQRKATSAYRELSNVLRLEPTHQDALERIMVLVEVLECYDNSIKLHDHLTQVTPYNAGAWFNLGRSYLLAGERAEAVEAFEYTYIVHPRHKYAYCFRADVLLEQADYQEALATCAEGLTNHPEDAELLIIAGRAYDGLAQYDEAIGAYRRAVERDPENADAYYHLGEALIETEAYREATTTLERAARLDARHESIPAALAEAYTCLQRYEEADVQYNRAIELAPESPEPWLNFARYHLEQQSYETALHLLETARNHCSAPELHFAEVACLVLSGLRQEGYNLLMVCMTHHADRSASLFEFAPELQEDSGLRHYL